MPSWRGGSAAIVKGLRIFGVGLLFLKGDNNATRFYFLKKYRRVH